MMLDYSENRTRDAWRELDRATWHYHQLRHWSITVENLLPSRLQYQEPPYALPEALLAPVTHNDPRDPYIAARNVATALATDNDDSLTHEETSPSEPQGSSPQRARQVNARGQGSNANEAGGQGGAPTVRECTFSGFMKCNPTVFHGHEGAVELSRWFEKTEMVFRISECAEARKVKFVAATLQGRTLTWWNSQVATRGLEAANQIGWTKMKRLMTEEFYLCPIEVTFIGSKPTSLNEAVRMAHALMKQKAQAQTERIAEGNKRKCESSQGGNNGGYAGNKRLCNRCRKHHFGYCKVVCNNYEKAGHMARDCKGKAIATGANARPTVTCYDCGEKGHTRNYCPKRKDPQGEEA
ncbi:putative reverse transcriptase domain-containing protein [Tanacetum coccineum]